MLKFTEETLKNWTKPPSDTEEQKLENAERMVREAINENEKLKTKPIDIFGQGSYANNTNVKLNSDIDINIQFTGGFYFDLPAGKTRADFGLDTPIEYTFSEFKNDVEYALREKFGKDSLLRDDKCITVFANSYRVETDVVPTWEHRKYSNNGAYETGSKFITDSGKEIINYPKQHIENGIKNNTETQRRFKRLTRLHKKLRYKMIDGGLIVNDSITSFLLECLVWNVPNYIFNDYLTWDERLKKSIIFLYENTKEENLCSEWGEVSELLYLFKGDRKWSIQDVNEYMVELWNYLEYR